MTRSHGRFLDINSTLERKLIEQIKALVLLEEVLAIETIKGHKLEEKDNPVTLTDEFL